MSPIPIPWTGSARVKVKQTWNHNIRVACLKSGLARLVLYCIILKIYCGPINSTAIYWKYFGYAAAMQLLQ
jgi:hypothetical protein